MQSTRGQRLVDKDEMRAAAGISAAIWRFPNSISTGIEGIMMGMGLLALPFYVASLLYIVSISLLVFLPQREGAGRGEAVVVSLGCGSLP